MRGTGLALVLACALALSCSSTSIDGTVRIDGSDSGSTVTVPLSEELEVTLRIAQPMLSCRWVITELDTAVLENTGHRLEPDDPEYMDGPEDDIWVFTPRSEGTTLLRFEWLHAGSGELCSEALGYGLPPYEVTVVVEAGE